MMYFSILYVKITALEMSAIYRTLSIHGKRYNELQIKSNPDITHIEIRLQKTNTCNSCVK